MKKLITLFLIAGTSALAFAQDSAVVCGKIPEDANKTFRIYEENVPKITFSTKIDSTGYFHITIPCSGENYYVFGDGREIQTIYVHPADSIYITLDTKYFDETATYSGKGATESNILKRFYMIGELTKSDYPAGYKEIFQNQPKKLFARIDKIKDVKLSLLSDIEQDTAVSKVFIAREKKRIIIDALNALLILKYGYERYNRLYLALYTDSLKNANIFSEIPYDTALFSYYPYRNVMDNYLSYLAKKEFNNDTVFYNNKSYGIKAAQINTIIRNKEFTPKFKDYCLYNETSLYLRSNYTFDELPAYYSDFKENCHSDNLKEKISETLTKNQTQIENFAKEDSSLLKDRNFMNFTSSYFRNLATNSMQKNGKDFNYENYIEKQLDLIDEKVSSHLLKDRLYFGLIRNYINRSATGQDKNLIKRFQETCRTKSYKKKIDELLDNLKKLREKMPAPDFTCVDINGKEHSLSNYKGKFVYIDIWATWCSPCRRQIPFLDKLRKEYKDKNIVFISVSIDDDIEKWKAMVKNDKMPEVQLYAPDAWKSNIAKEYVVQFIPRFILIDENGKIISADADRPSSEKIRKTFDKYIK